MKGNKFLLAAVAFFAFVGVAMAGPSKALAASDLEIQKTASPSLVKTAEKVTYAIVFQNNTQYVIKDFKVKDVLPGGFSYVAGSSVGDAGEPSVAGEKLTWKIDKIGAGKVLTIVYKASVGASVKSGTYKNTAYALGESASAKVEVKKVKVAEEDAEEKEASDDNQDNSSASEADSEEVVSDLDTESSEAVASASTGSVEGDADENENNDTDKKEDDSEKEDAEKDTKKESKKLTEEELKTGQSVAKDKKDKEEEGDSSSLIFVLVILFLAAVALTYFEIRKLKNEKEEEEGQPHLWE